MKWALPEIGSVFRVDYPMIRDTFTDYDESGAFESQTWRPGVRYEQDGPDEVRAFADGLGQMVLTVVGVYKPGKFPTRVFYTRQWISPEGKPFGNGSLKVTTTDVFRRRSEKFQVGFTLVGDPPTEGHRS